jgi:hypothetical protein
MAGRALLWPSLLAEPGQGWGGWPFLASHIRASGGIVGSDNFALLSLALTCILLQQRRVKDFQREDCTRLMVSYGELTPLQAGLLRQCQEAETEGGGDIPHLSLQLSSPRAGLEFGSL